MDKYYEEIYTNQAGTGISMIPFQGYKYQRGHGFFSSIWKFINPLIKPLGKYLGKQALSTGMAIGTDVLKGENIKASAKKRLKETRSQVLNDAIDRAKLFAQTGKGRRRRRRTKIKQVKNKIKPKKSTKRKSKRRKKLVRKKKLKSKHLKHIF